MIDAGVLAVLTCIDPWSCPRELAGRTFEHALLRDLSSEGGPCGENGEYHSFAYAGPAFQKEVPVERGDVVERGGFVFADVLPKGFVP
jgi:diphthamide synthase (EF-2-diphthine--ammonia ligase)